MGPTAFVFPGQGSQKVGMGLDLIEDHPHLREAYFARADEILDFDLSSLCFEGPEESLLATENTQPAIFTMSMAVLDVLRTHNVEPQAVAGHSLGEYSALVCAGVLTFEDGLRLVRRRGQLMATVSRVTPGTMCAVMGVPPEPVEQACATARSEGVGIVEVANYNDPEQTVISGEAAAVTRAGELAAEAGGRVVPLPVSAPFHCSLMDALADEFAAELDRYDFADPIIPVVANATGDWVRTAEEVKEALRRQVAGAVRWTATLNLLADGGFERLVEVGPNRVLWGTAAKTVPALTAHATGDRRRLAKTLKELAQL